MAEAAAPRSASLELFAGMCAILAALAAFLYAVSFIVLQNELLSGLFLMLTGLFSIAALVTSRPDD